MTFTEFLKQLTQEQVDAWWNTIVTADSEEKVEDRGWKYKLSKNGQSFAFKWAIKELASYYNIDLDLKDFSSNDVNRNKFCDSFNFEIEEELVYVKAESNSFITFYSSLKQTQPVFQEAIEYLNNIVLSNEINHYKTRMAIRQADSQMMVVIGMRAVFAFKEINGKARIALILDEVVFESYKDSLNIIEVERFKGSKDSKLLVSIDVSNWHEIPKDILDSNTVEIVNEYIKVKDTKRATWNIDATTTNGVLKYLIFKGENIEQWVENNKPISYWIFQGNPQYFDVVGALQNKHLQTWKVAAHKDKIKVNDKIILWLSGKNSGCYALAKVVSEVSKIQNNAEEISYYKSGYDENEDRVRIEIEYNLCKKPILWDSIKQEESFLNFKGGNQGTNFSSSKGEYDAILKLVSKMKNLKLEFVDWMITNDSDERYYFSKQFGSNRNRFQKEIDNYETTYKACFKEDLFSIDTKNFEDNIASIRTNIYDKSNPFSKYSKERSSGRPMAILGKKNYLKFLQEYFMPNATINKLLVNISWNSKNWKEESKDNSNHSWVKEGGVPHESWNFAIDAEGNTEDYLFGYAKFTHPPKIEGKSIFIFYSDGKIVGFYGDASLKEAMRNGQPLNLSGQKALSFVLENKIENILDKGFFEDGKRIGQIGFNYLKKNETVIKILDEALRLNPNQTNEINRLRNWFLHETAIPETMNDNPNFNAPLNQILYGPPGTGKTYHTINKALKIINEEEEKKLDWSDRKSVKELFDKRVDEGRIVFTTFHQSMNYEDFIEGIKPEEPENEGEPVVYKIKYGIFRNHCIEASFEIAQLREDDITEEVLDFSILYDRFVEDIEERLIEGDLVELEIKNGGKVIVEGISQQRNVIIKHHSGEITYTVSKARLTKLQASIKELDQVNNINDEFRSIIGGSNSSAYWSVLNAIRKEKVIIPQNKEKRKYTFEEKKEVVFSLSKADFKNKKGKPFVLIIDEINRGNVSQIFGELITLIEDDKRLGMDEALEVTLPYSKEKFGVPPNLHIIGTMNTADRSVEALDTALRRRFCFEEMQPKYDLKELEGVVFGSVVKDILKIINSRIEKLIDSDHAIGHSYFININEVSIIDSFYRNIIPLLQEYFFGDYSKLGLVLGKGFIKLKEWDDNNDSFADFDSGNDFDDRDVYEIIDYRKTNDYMLKVNGIDIVMTFEKAIKILMKQPIA